jgi:hypothetical protein
MYIETHTGAGSPAGHSWSFDEAELGTLITDQAGERIFSIFTST